MEHGPEDQGTGCIVAYGYGKGKGLSVLNCQRVTVTDIICICITGTIGRIYIPLDYVGRLIATVWTA